MDIKKVKYCRCLNKIWNLNPGDITGFKIIKKSFHFEAEDDEGISMWDSWTGDNDTFLKYFELIDPNAPIIKPNYDYLIPFLKENNIV